MKVLALFISIVWSAILCFAQQPSAVSVNVTRWPQDRDAAISLTFDDGMNSQLDNAWPILRKHHLNGTFFVSMRVDGFEQRKQEWKRVAQEGNELGNHSVNHPCLLPEITPHSQSYSPEMMEAEIRDAAQEITKLLGRDRGLTYAYPCGNMTFGPPRDQVRNAALFIRFVSEHSFGARGAEGGGPQDPEGLSALSVTDLGVTAGKDFRSLLALAEQGVRDHQWGVYCFHGIGAQWLSIENAALDDLAAYLEGHPQIWTATFGDVLRYTQERHAASIQVEQVNDNQVDIVMDWPLDAAIYDLPLTLKIVLPAGWTAVSANADGKSLGAKVVMEGQRATALVDVPAQTKAVQLARSIQTSTH